MNLKKDPRAGNEEEKREPGPREGVDTIGKL